MSARDIVVMALGRGRVDDMEAQGALVIDKQELDALHSLECSARSYFRTKGNSDTEAMFSMLKMESALETLDKLRGN